MEHLPLAEREAGLPGVRLSPSDRGTVELVVRRPAENERELLDEAEIDADAGVVGDMWRIRPSSKRGDGSPNPLAQVTLMNVRAAGLIAGEAERRPLAGDQLYVDFDLSAANIPPGTRLRVGTALLEVTDDPHLGCGKFAKRFGVDAVKFVNSAVGRELNLRGVNTRVIAGGVVRQGDEIAKA